MKHVKAILITGSVLMFLSLSSAMAGNVNQFDGGHRSSREHSSHDMSGMNPSDLGKDMGSIGQDIEVMGHSGHKGENIRNATVDGYTFSYHLIDMQERMKEMKAAGHPHEMKMTHHLMVYVQGPDGNMVKSAKVGYLVVGPDKEKQKLMCMAMAGGYGADINFTAPGIYTVKTKVMIGKQSILDSFTYDIK